MLILSLALTLPAAIALLSGGFHTAEENLTKNRTITAFLNPQLSDGDARQLAGNLAGNKKILSAALSATQIRGKEVLTIDIQPTAILGRTELDNIVSELDSHSHVDYVDADTTWLEQNINAVNTTKSLAMISTILNVLLTTILVFSMTKIDLRRRQPDRIVLNQMGISRSTLQRPQLWRSLLLALAAVSVATGLAWAALELASRLEDMSTYQVIIPASLSLERIIWLPFIAALTCVLSVKLLHKER